MGRRSTKTTKTGKFMNPTDQWRESQVLHAAFKKHTVAVVYIPRGVHASSAERAVVFICTLSSKTAQEKNKDERS